MTRDQWIGRLDGWDCPTTITPDERRELAALLREPGLTDDELATLRQVHSAFAGYLTPQVPAIAALAAIIARHSPPPKVEWVDRGIFSTAVHGDFSLLVQKQCDGQFAPWVRKGQAADDHPRCAFNTRDLAKRAAEARLAELMREGK